MLAYLHTHTDYSILDGMCRPKQILKRAKELGASAVSINDHATVAGHIDFLNAAKEVGIKAILGYEAYEWNEKYHENRKKRWHTNFWAKNDEGLKNLWAIASLANIDAHKGHIKPDSSYEHYKKHGKGVIASSACLGGALSKFAKENDIERAEWYVNRMTEIFDDFYIEIHTNKEKEQPAVNRWLMDFAKKRNIKTIYAIDSHYVYEDDAKTHETILGAQTHAQFDTPKRFVMRPDYFIQSEEEIRKRLEYLGDEDIDRCFEGVRSLVEDIEGNYKIDKENKLPSFGNGDPIDKLKRDCLKSLFEKFNVEKNKKGNYEMTHKTKCEMLPYLRRLVNEEFPVILENGLADYFLITADYVKWARERMLVGPARGSGAGSLVNYLLKITTIDPLKYDLPFARFLNEGRVKSNYKLELEDGSNVKVDADIEIKDTYKGKKIIRKEYNSGSLPDIDVDFSDWNRHKVPQYLIEKYGDKYIARIGTIGRMKIKAALKKCATYWKVPFKEANEMSKKLDAIPDIWLVEEEEKSWEEVLDAAPEDLQTQFAVWEDKYPSLFRDMKKIINMAHAYGKHASAFLISPVPLEELPVRKVFENDEETLVTQWDGTTIESLGFVKADILGLRTLTTLEVAANLVKERHNIDIDFYNIEEESESGIWEMLEIGNTLGCFQIETHAITKVIKNMKPKSIEDISAAIALYRPGVLQAGMLGVYLDRRKANDPQLLHPDLEPILGNTFGIFLYQEQVMNVCVKFANYTMVEADNMRKILGKKMMDKMPFEEKRFKERALSNGYEKNLIDELWRQISVSGTYLFNRSHSISYATITYWTAYMKYYYPIEFLCALMTTNLHKVPQYIIQAKKQGFKVMPPDVLYSQKGFSVLDDETILFGLEAVKGVGERAADAIIEGRPFENLFEFSANVSSKCNKTHRKNLAAIDAFRSICKKEEAIDAFDATFEKTQDEIETELLGLVISSDKFEEPYEALGQYKKELTDYENIADLKYGSEFMMLVDIREIKEYMTKTNKKMCFVKLGTREGEEFEASAFSKSAQSILGMKEGDILLVELEKQFYNGGDSFVIKKVKKFG